jgi:predicted naringenin-chalcone synthase
MTATILETGTAQPRFEYDQATIKERLVRWLEEAGGGFRKYAETLDTNLVERRALAIPLEEAFTPRSVGTKNAVYVEEAVRLGEEAVRKCLAKAKVDAADVDCFISTSCTGFTIPSLDALIAHRLGMKRALSRLPITEFGCAGGALGLSLAATHLIAHPGRRVLLLSVELASLTFRPDDFSAENVVSAGLFSDGAAAVLLSTERHPARPRIVATASRLFPGSAELMAFRLTDTGFKIVLSREIPAAIREHAVPALVEFLAGHGLVREDVDHWLLHPGGRKIVESFEDAFGLGRGGLEISRRVLRTRGNLSSATVLCILDDFLDHGLGKPGDIGVLAAFGPGFGAEMLLLEW